MLGLAVISFHTLETTVVSISLIPKRLSSSDNVFVILLPIAQRRREAEQDLSPGWLRKSFVCLADLGPMDIVLSLVGVRDYHCFAFYWEIYPYYKNRDCFVFLYISNYPDVWTPSKDRDRFGWKKWLGNAFLFLLKTLRDKDLELEHEIKIIILIRFMYSLAETKDELPWCPSLVRW